MKWRQSIVYLLVLLLVGGYFYYFEVVKKGEKEAADRESKKVFTFQPNQVKALEVTSASDKIRIERDGQWKIVAPIKADGDKLTLEGMAASLSNLMMQREIAPSAQDLKPFGLQDPALKVGMLVGDQWQEILFGDSNPTGDARYAKTATKPNVFLVAANSFNEVNKNLKDLRKKELFAFLPEDVAGLVIARTGSSKLSVETGDEGRTWKSPDAPEVRIKTAKVANVIEQIRYLRATAFLENEPQNLAAHGLEPPAVTVGIRLRDGRTVELKLGSVDEVKRQVAALGSELPAVVEVSAGILKDIPKDVQGLEDRSVASIDWDGVTQVKWRKGDASGHVVRLGKNRWGMKKDGGPGKDAGQPQEFKDSWHVGSLLWDFRDAEFESRGGEPASVPEKPSARLELLDDAKVLIVLTWGGSEAQPGGPVPVWVEQDGATTRVNVKAEVLQRAEDDLDHIVKAEPAKPGL